MMLCCPNCGNSVPDNYCDHNDCCPNCKFNLWKYLYVWKTDEERSIAVARYREKLNKKKESETSSGTVKSLMANKAKFMPRKVTFKKSSLPENVQKAMRIASQVGIAKEAAKARQVAMEKKEQVFLYMKEEIERLANLEEEKILDEAKRLEEEAYNQIKAEAKKDAEALLAKELVEISSNASVEASSSQEEKTKKLVEKRDEYVANIFSEAKDKLVAFANSKDYQAYLVKHMEEIGKLYPMSDSTLELREADMKYKDELIKAYGTALEVEVSDKITIGGFIVKNKATNVVVDESLDFALENQKDWFYKTSGLMIK